MNSYDEIKGMLNKIRKIQAMPTYGLLKEQEDEYNVSDGATGLEDIEMPPNSVQKPGEESNEDLAVINNVEVEIHSEDPEDLEISDEEKGKISQLIDDFRTEVSEIAEFDKLHIYPDSAKLDGKIGGLGLNFTLSTGDDTGLYLSSTSLLKIDDSSLGMITKLKGFEQKFSNTINDLLVNRREL